MQSLPWAFSIHISMALLGEVSTEDVFQQYLQVEDVNTSIGQYFV